jgi:hypothetical protein
LSAFTARASGKQWFLNFVALAFTAFAVLLAAKAHCTGWLVLGQPLGAGSLSQLSPPYVPMTKNSIRTAVSSEEVARAATSSSDFVASSLA